jgi:hypothetical protein
VRGYSLRLFRSHPALQHFRIEKMPPCVDMQIPGFNLGGGYPDIYQSLSQIHQNRFPANRAAPAVGGKQVAVPACFFEQLQIGNQ